ncbi:MAG: UPF0280 family protein [Burkholderiaceae bacterium]
MRPQRALLSGHRQHFAHGPIDLVIGAEGEACAVAAAHEAAWQRFATVLDELVAELPALRRAVAGSCPLQGRIARRMWQACSPFRGRFITPMAAVAGAVAQELIAAYEREGIDRAWVNNGGDIALHLASGRSLRVGLLADLARTGELLQRGAPGLDAHFTVTSDLPVRGIATSGWRGRSFSLGIADSVTVLARSASEADAAATMVANAVDVDDARIVRRPACELKDDSDLGDIPVTVDVPVLARETVERALGAGLLLARELQSAGLIWSCVLVCQGGVASTDGAGPAALSTAARSPTAAALAL